MNFAEVMASVGAEQLDEAVERLQELPSESVPLEQIRPWIFHAHTPLRQLVVTLLGQQGDVDSIVDLASLFEADLEVGSVIPFDGSGERPYMLSEEIADTEHPFAIEIIEEWRSRGGGR